MNNRICIYCPSAPGWCIRSHRGEDGHAVHIYACEGCRAARGLHPLYKLEAPAAAVPK
ncbi:hypothetical protein [Streptomyces hydrogenans]|uniref:hypothetical protein n=1 Tax=Streptomyces hydrogenans TaxID=1873719 RepID=UPI0036E1DDE9